MTDFFFRRNDIFPVGTSVGAYDGLDVIAPEGRPPTAALIDSASMTAEGLTFTGLAESGRYWAVGQVDTDYRWMGFFTAPSQEIAVGPEGPDGPEGPPGLDGGMYVNVKSPEHGAVGDGIADDTAAIDSAVEQVVAFQAGVWDDVYFGDYLDGPPLFFPAGRYIYNGDALWDHDALGANNINILGSGPGATEIVLGDGSYLVTNTGGNVINLRIEDLSTMGGAGIYRDERTGINVLKPALVRNCVFQGYSGAAFNINSTDWPYWTIEDCTFFGHSDTDRPIGIAMEDPSAGFYINRCHFAGQYISVKAGSQGNGIKIRDCDFVPFNTPTGTARYALWIVSTSETNTGGVVGEIAGNKFGNEGLIAGDHHIIFADEGAGATVADRAPVLGSDSSGYVIGLKIGPNTFLGNTTWEAGGGTDTQYIYSTTPQLIGCDIGPITVGGTPPDMVLRLRSPAVVYETWANSVGPLYINRAFGQVAVSNAYLPIPTINPNHTLSSRDVDGRFNVKDYGAVGDGFADDTAACQAALNAAPAGSIVYFPAALVSYKLTDTLTIPDVRGIRLVGESWETSKLEMTVNNKPILQTSGQFQRSYGIEELRLTYTNQQNYASHPNSVALAFDGPTGSALYNSLVRRIYIERATFGIRVTQSGGSTFQVWGNTFEEIQCASISHTIFDSVGVATPAGNPSNILRRLVSLDDFGVGTTTGTALILFGDFFCEALDIEDWTGRVVIWDSGNGTINGLYLERYTFTDTQAIVQVSNGRYSLLGMHAIAITVPASTGGVVLGPATLSTLDVLNPVVLSGTVTGGSGLYYTFRPGATERLNTPYPDMDGVSGFKAFSYPTGTETSIRVTGGGVGGLPAAVASAATVTLPDYGEAIPISGTTTITSITASWAEREVTLIFTGALTFTDGSNLKLNGNYVTTADDTITLVCDGTNWFEKCRSAN